VNKPDGDAPEWITRRERGTVTMLRFIVWVALCLGRPVARLLLYPICVYFLLFSPRPRRASRDYLGRALGRKPSPADLFRHYYNFAACALDRVYLLNDQIERFEIEVHDEKVVRDILRQGSGCLLFGAHFGSFEVLRALGRQASDLRLSFVMYEENARKIGSVLNAINPRLTMDVIALGRPDSLIEAESRLDNGHLVGILADRALNAEEERQREFLGAPASFPFGPFRMAALLQRPVVLMFGVYRGGRRYDIFFERLPTGDDHTASGREQADRTMTLYVERLEAYCRMAPFNWFNFYDFWQ
jgi:predicted LPLAT superfamily acyltransferase